MTRPSLMRQRRLFILETSSFCGDDFYFLLLHRSWVFCTSVHLIASHVGVDWLTRRQSMAQKRPSRDRPARAAPLGFLITNSAPHRSHVRRRRSSAFRRRLISPFRFPSTLPQIGPHAWRLLSAARNGLLQMTQIFDSVFTRGLLGRGLPAYRPSRR